MRRRGILLCAVPVVLVFFLLAAWSLGLSRAPDSKPPPFNELSTILSRARVAFEKGDLRQSEELVKIHLMDHRTDKDGLLLLAQIFERTDRTADSSKLFLALAQFLNEEDRRTAIQCLSALTVKESTNFAALKALSICLRDSGNSMGALAAAHKALAIDPGDRELIDIMAEAAERAARPGIPSSKSRSAHTSIPSPYDRRARQ